jgi:YbbR domain-containing protein
VQTILISEQKSVVNLPVNLKSIPKNVTLERLPQTIPFSVRGKGLDILKLRLSKTKVIIDASKVKPGTDIISLTDYTIDLPENINLNLIGPVNKQEIAIHADVFHQKKVSVVLSFADNYTKQRFSSLNYHIIPERVTIFGPKNKVETVQNVTTESISRDMLSERDFKLKLSPLSDDLSASEADVRVRVSSSYNTTKVFDDIPIVNGTGKSYFPARVAVKISGDSDILKTVDARKIKITVSVDADAAGMYPLSVELPEGLELVAITPDKVHLKN